MNQTEQDADTLRTVRDFIRWGASEFARADLVFGHGTDNALDEAFHLVTWALKLPHDLPAAYLAGALTAAERGTVVDLLRTRVQTRKPAAYLTGEAWFAGLPFTVDERVLVPRSPIAELIERRFQPWLEGEPDAILDLCAGSGCIGIACAFMYPDAAVDAAELDDGALEILRANIRRHHLEERVTARQTDLFTALDGRRYDLIVSNPPYVASQEWEALAPEYKHEPRVALDAGGDGMDLVGRILVEAPRHLNDGGLLVCEIGGSQEAFARRWPDFPGFWPDFEHGGDGVFVIQRDDLEDWLRRV